MPEVGPLTPNLGFDKIIRVLQFMSLMFGVMALVVMTPGNRSA